MSETLRQHGNLRDLTGEKFGRLTVIERGPNGRNRKVRWWCDCKCGGSSLVQSCNLRSGHTLSCGCWMREQMARVGEHNRSHGHAAPRTSEYMAWESMVQRCTNPKHKWFGDYGGRGIWVCDRWRDSFPEFLKDMGARPDGLSLDRIDNESGYWAGNCRWATRSEQARNRRPRRKAS